MGRPRRPLTPVERAEKCPLCGAGPGQRCTGRNGVLYTRGHHAARESAAIRYRRRAAAFSTERIHPRTLAQVWPGTPVIILDAYGRYHRRIAQTRVVHGHDFLVVWVSRPEEADAARRENRDPAAVPWPAEDVWLPGDEADSGDA